jgi:predicted metal-dependent hydrolase
MAVDVTRKAIRNMYLRVNTHTGAVEVHAPRYVSNGQIAELVRSHTAWIERRRQELRETPVLEWTDELKNKARSNLEAQIPDLLNKWTPMVGREPTQITFRAMTSRWGSCTPATGRIRLNLLLGLMEPRFLEYVLVHELAHLWVPGHDAGFQQLMDSYLPQWRVLRREISHVIAR